MPEPVLWIYKLALLVTVTISFGTLSYANPIYISHGPPNSTSLSLYGRGNQSFESEQPDINGLYSFDHCILNSNKSLEDCGAEGFNVNQALKPMFRECMNGQNASIAGCIRVVLTLPPNQQPTIDRSVLGNIETYDPQTVQGYSYIPLMATSDCSTTAPKYFVVQASAHAATNFICDQAVPAFTKTAVEAAKKNTWVVAAKYAYQFGKTNGGWMKTRMSKAGNSYARHRVNSVLNMISGEALPDPARVLENPEEFFKGLCKKALEHLTTSSKCLEKEMDHQGGNHVYHVGVEGGRVGFTSDGKMTKYDKNAKCTNCLASFNWTFD